MLGKVVVVMRLGFCDFGFPGGFDLTRVAFWVWWKLLFWVCFSFLNLGFVVLVFCFVGLG